MEYLLITCLDDCDQKRIPTGSKNIIVKAFSLFPRLKRKTNSKRIPRYFLPAEGGLKSLNWNAYCQVNRGSGEWAIKIQPPNFLHVLKN
jgi:hypothetical protein